MATDASLPSSRVRSATLILFDGFVALSTPLLIVPLGRVGSLIGVHDGTTFFLPFAAPFITLGLFLASAALRGELRWKHATVTGLFTAVGVGFLLFVYFYIMPSIARAMDESDF